jgi:diacylglycerol kinase family enzyme
LRGFLLINPRAGRGGPSAEELAAVAKERGIRPWILSGRDDPAELAREADTDIVGVAGGDGSLGPVAEVAIERKLPFVCVPFGTRNHFARDLGLDRRDPVAALDAFAGDERLIDVGCVDGRLFLNNVSFGAYASLVHRRERHRRRRDALARARALVRTVRHPHRLRLTVDGRVLSARVILVANNAYELRVFELGARDSLNEGRLYLYSADGVLPTAWEEQPAQRFEFGGSGRLRGALDGEPVELERPFECRVEPRALRVLVPPGS